MLHNVGTKNLHILKEEAASVEAAIREARSLSAVTFAA